MDKSKKSNVQNKVVFIIILLVGALICYSIKDIFNALLTTLVFYTILRPMQKFLVEKKSWNSRLSAILLMVASVFVIVIPISGLTYMVISKLSTLPIDTIKIEPIIEKLNQITPFEINYKGILVDAAKNAAQFMSNVVPSLITGTFGFFLNLIIMYFLLYFMLVERKIFEQTILKYMPFKPSDTMLFAKEMRNTTYSNVLGQGVIAIVQGLLTGLGFWIFNYPDPMFWGVVTIFISFIPVLGPPLIFIPAALIQILEGNQFSGYGMLAFGLIVIINIDNVLRFAIAKKIADTHPIITVIGVIIGVPLFGILGLVFGPLLLSYFVLLIKVLERNMTIKIEMSDDTEAETL